MKKYPALAKVPIKEPAPVPVVQAPVPVVPPPVVQAPAPVVQIPQVDTAAIVRGQLQTQEKLTQLLEGVVMHNKQTVRVKILRDPRGIMNELIITKE